MLLPTATSCSNCHDNWKRGNNKNIITLKSFSTIQKSVDSLLRVLIPVWIENWEQAMENRVDDW